MATIFDVAREAGVSKSTVSRVLNNDEKVKENTRIAVENAIQKFSYSPSYFAQGLRTRKTKTIALLVPEYTNIFYGEMFKGVEDIALQRGYMVLVCNTERHTTTESEYIEELLKRNVEGIIYNTYNMNETMIQYLEKISIETPVIFMDETIQEHKNLPYVFTDGFQSTKEAVKYLAKRNKKRIGYIRNINSISVTEYRFQGYLKGLEECGLQQDAQYIYQAETDEDADYVKTGNKAADYFASLKEKPDAILTAIDLLGIGCVQELKRKGIKIPQDINVIGFDNISLGELVEPSLTTIAQPTRQLGRKAAEILIGLIEGNATETQVVYQGELLIRETTD